MVLRGFLFLLLFFYGVLFAQSDLSEIRSTIQALRSYHYAHQKAAIQRLTEVGELAIPELLRSLRTTKELRFQEGLRLALAKQGQKAVPFLLQELDKNPNNALNVMASLSLMPKIEMDVTKEILPWIANSSDVQKMYTLNVLGKMNHAATHREALNTLLKAAEDEKISIRMQALISLRNFSIHSKEIIPLFLKAADDRRTQRIALESMGKMNSSDSKMLGILVKNLQGSHQSTAALALISLGTTADAFLLQQLKNTRETKLRKQRILDVLAAVKREKEHLEQFRYQLLKLLDDKQICQKVLQILGSIGIPKNSEQKIILCLEDPAVRSEAIIVLGRVEENIAANAEQLLPFLQEKKWRLVVMNALQEMGEAANISVPHLLALLNENSPELHQRVGETLKKLGKESISQLESLLQTTDYPIGVFTAIQEIGKDAAPLVPDLLTNIKTQDDATLVGILSALASIRENIVPSLEIVSELTEHSNPRVQNKAIEVIGKVGSQAGAAVPRLVKLLPKVEPTTAFQILTALGRIGAPAESALPALKKLRKTSKNIYILRSIPSVEKRIIEEIKKQEQKK